MKPNWDTKPSARKLVRRFLDLFTPPERMKCSEWSERYRRLSPEASARSGGAFSFDEAPWQREPLDSPGDPDVSHTVLMWASQTTGKTETVNNMIGYTIDIDPCPMLVVLYSLDMAEMWSKDRLSTMLRDTPRLRGKVRDVRSRESGNTLLQKRFPAGDVAVAGANSPGGLASRPRRKVLFDEVDRYPASAGTEGDPVLLGEQRTESYPDAEIVMVSSPGNEGTSRIEKAFKGSDQRRWFVPCPLCGGWQHLKWEQVKWDSDKVTVKDAVDADEDGSVWVPPENPRYICEHCDGAWNDAMRQAAVRAGEWRATAKFTGIRGYHINGINCLFRPKKPFKNRMQQMVAKFLQANAGGEQTLKVWTNTFLAETWKVKGLEVKPHDLMKRQRTWNGRTLHPRCLVVTSSWDVQQDRIEGEFIGWGEGYECWGLGYFVIPGDTNLDKTWDDLDRLLLEKEFDHPSGQRLKAAMTFIDLGFRPQRVVRFTRAREARNIHACAGNKTPWAVLCSRPTRTTNRKAVKFQIGGDAAKEDLYSRLSIQDEGPGYCHFPLGYCYDEEYFKQLTAEKLVTELDERGMIKKKHFVKQRERNEALDVRCYGRGAVEFLNCNWRALAKRLEVKEQPPMDTNKHESTDGDSVKQKVEQPVNHPARPSNFRPARGTWRSGRGGGWR